MKNNILINDKINYTFVSTHQRVDEIHCGWLDDYQGKGHYALGGYGVYFECEEDATVFALRWA